MAQVFWYTDQEDRLEGSEAGKTRLAIAQRTLQECGISRAQLARDTGLHQTTLWAWGLGRRVPSPESLEKLAAGLERRSTHLARLAADIMDALRGP